MKKRILITGATDGLGLETSKDLVKCGHELLIHGRNTHKLDRVICLLRELNPDVKVEGFVADLSRLGEVVAMASGIGEKYEYIDVLINNAGVFMMSDPVTEEGMDTRIVVNTIAPYILSARPEKHNLLEKRQPAHLTEFECFTISPLHDCKHVK